jgi:cell wall-associated NlpC family hydrolase
VADVRHDPADSAELVTQALLGTLARPLEHPLQNLEERDSGSEQWTRVRLPDYEGWMRTAELGAPVRRAEQMAVVTQPRARFYSPLSFAGEDEQPLGEVYAATTLPVLAIAKCPGKPDMAHVLLPNRVLVGIMADAVAVRPAAEPVPQREPQEVLALAHALLGTPYLWGGTTARGIDCSGLSQLCWRHAGRTIPRDADQQYEAIPYCVGRDQLQPGDLIYFASDGRITHVALALGGARLIHASGSAGCVTLNSLDPADEDYSPRLAEMYAGARRPWAQP